MIVEKQMECRLAGETEVLGENLPQHHFWTHIVSMVVNCRVKLYLVTRISNVNLVFIFMSACIWVFCCGNALQWFFLLLDFLTHRFLQIANYSSWYPCSVLPWGLNIASGWWAWMWLRVSVVLVRLTTFSRMFYFQLPEDVHTRVTNVLFSSRISDDFELQSEPLLSKQIWS
jgi:hypothetical protein